MLSRSIDTKVSALPCVDGTFVLGWLIGFISAVSEVEPALKGLSGNDDLYGHPNIPFQSLLFGGSDLDSLDFAGVVGDVDFTGACEDSQNALNSYLEAGACSDGQPVQI